jgi:hypothetical protein
LQENEFKELNLVLFESLFLGLYILFYTIFGHTNTEAQQSDELAPQNVQMTLQVVLSASSKFCLWASLKICGLQMMENA